MELMADYRVSVTHCCKPVSHGGPRGLQRAESSALSFFYQLAKGSRGTLNKSRRVGKNGTNLALRRTTKHLAD